MPFCISRKQQEMKKRKQQESMFRGICIIKTLRRRMSEYYKSTITGVYCKYYKVEQIGGMWARAEERGSGSGDCGRRQHNVIGGRGEFSSLVWKTHYIAAGWPWPGRGASTEASQKPGELNYLPLCSCQQRAADHHQHHSRVNCRRRRRRRTIKMRE